MFEEFGITCISLNALPDIDDHNYVNYTGKEAHISETLFLKITRK